MSQVNNQRSNESSQQIPSTAMVTATTSTVQQNEQGPSTALVVAAASAARYIEQGPSTAMVTTSSTAQYTDQGPSTAMVTTTNSAGQHTELVRVSRVLRRYETFQNPRKPNVFIHPGKYFAKPQDRLFLCLSTLTTRPLVENSHSSLFSKEYSWSFLHIYGPKSTVYFKKMHQYSWALLESPEELGESTLPVRRGFKKESLEKTNGLMLTIVYFAKIRDLAAFEAELRKVVAPPDDVAGSDWILNAMIHIHNTKLYPIRYLYKSETRPEIRAELFAQAVLYTKLCVDQDHLSNGPKDELPMLNFFESQKENIFTGHGKVARFGKGVAGAFQDLGVDGVMSIMQDIFSIATAAVEVDRLFRFRVVSIRPRNNSTHKGRCLCC